MLEFKTQQRDLGAIFSAHRVKKVLFFFHFCAALALDEHIALNALAQKPFAFRLLTPGAPVTPLWPWLPKRQTITGAASYGLFVAAGAYLLAASGDNSMLGPVVLGLFLVASSFDVGLFFSTRPSDILKFWVALMPFGDGDGDAGVEPNFGMNVNLWLVALLYFWSGVSKL